jgi:hypothetical protein
MRSRCPNACCGSALSLVSLRMIPPHNGTLPPSEASRRSRLDTRSQCCNRVSLRCRERGQKPRLCEGTGQPRSRCDLRQLHIRQALPLQTNRRLGEISGPQYVTNVAWVKIFALGRRCAFLGHPHEARQNMLKLRSIGLSDYSVLEGRQRIGRIRLATERMPCVWLLGRFRLCG